MPSVLTAPAPAPSTDDVIVADTPTAAVDTSTPADSQSTDQKATNHTATVPKTASDSKAGDHTAGQVGGDAATGPEAAGLGLTLGVNPTVAKPGETLTFTVTVENKTKSELNEVAVWTKVENCEKSDLGTFVPNQVIAYQCTGKAEWEPGEHTVSATVTAIKDGYKAKDGGYQGKKLRTNATVTYTVKKDHGVWPSHPSLPVTGSNVGVVAGTGASLVVAGVALAAVAAFIGRRRRARR